MHPTNVLAMRIGVGLHATNALRSISAAYSRLATRFSTLRNFNCKSATSQVTRIPRLHTLPPITTRVFAIVATLAMVHCAYQFAHRGASTGSAQVQTVVCATCHRPLLASLHGQGRIVVHAYLMQQLAMPMHTVERAITLFHVFVILAILETEAFVFRAARVVTRECASLLAIVAALLLETPRGQVGLAKTVRCASKVSMDAIKMLRVQASIIHLFVHVIKATSMSHCHLHSLGVHVLLSAAMDV